MASAQTDGRDSYFASSHFDEWVAQGDHVSIPWKIALSKPVLDFHQRLRVAATVTVDGKNLANRGVAGELAMFVQFEDSAGKVAQVHAIVALRELSKDLRKADFIYQQEALVAPGNYRVTIAMHYSGTQEHNLGHLPLHVEPLAGDPLPGAWQDLPSVEILSNKEGPPAEWFRPDIEGSLNLRVENRLPMRVSLFMVLPSGRPSGTIYRDYMNALLPEFKIFSQWRIANGNLNLSFIDVSKHSVSDVSAPRIWSGVQSALEQNNPNVIDVRSLATRGGEAEFFVNEVSMRLKGATSSSDERSVEPMPVMIILGGPLLLGKGVGWIPPQIEAGKDYRIYYLRYVPQMLRQRIMRSPGMLPEPMSAESRDMNLRPREGPGPLPPSMTVPETLSLEDTLKPLHVQVLEVNSPEHFRQAMATILAELSQR